MNRERHKFWESYIRDLQSRMLLGHWDLTLERKLDADDMEACTEFAGPRNFAWITLGNEWESKSRTLQRLVLVHELIHLHMHPLHAYKRLTARDMEDTAKWVLITGHRSHEEFAVDQLARIIAPHMPLPPKGAKP